jgi:phosphatidylinositol alpha-1,6-mannosyltransferase
MRVLMLNNEFPPIGGGTGTVNQALLQRMVSVPDLEIDLITSSVGTSAEHQQFSERIRIIRLPVNRQDIHHASNRELIAYAVRALSLALRIHLAHPYHLAMAWSAVPAGGTALALRRLTGLHYLVRVCGPDIPGFELRYGRLYPVLTPMIKAIWHGADNIVAKCAGEAELIHAIDPDVRVELIPNGVDLALFRTARHSDNNAPLRILCVARLIERKGQSQLIEAVRRLTEQSVDVNLDFVGTGDALNVYQEQVDRFRLRQRVRFLGYVPRDEISDHYASADVFVLPSFSEGMSVATLEAMAAGLPVVVTSTGGTADLVVEGENGLTYNWGDVTRLVEHLKYLAENRHLLSRMGAASRQRAASFTWDAACERYLEFFERLGSPKLMPQVERAS